MSGDSAARDGAPTVTVLVAPGALADPHLARTVLDSAAAARGVDARLVVSRSTAELSAAVTDARAVGEAVIVPGSPSVGTLPLPGTGRLIRVDLADRPRDPSPLVRRHIRGRGLEGLRYAVDAWFFHRVVPSTVHPYGPDPDQHADLRLPVAAAGVPDAGFPVAVLVHGGYWRSRWESDLMEAMAADLGARGIATWNVEYRRPDDHDWAATTADVAAALRALPEVDGPLDLSRVAVLGHSAGGQLAVRLAADVAADPSAVVRPLLTVSLAGVLDLVDGDRRRLGDGAVADALGGSADDLPAVYRASSPLARVPVGSPLAVVCGDDDELLSQSRVFADAARAAGDDVVLLEGAGNHFAVIDPRSGIWQDVVRLVEQHLLR